MDGATRRKLAEAGFADLQAAISQFADIVLDRTGSGPTIAVGPVVWDVRPGHDVRYWYFMAATADAEGVFRIDQLGMGDDDDRSLADQSRAALLMEFAQRKPPSVVHSFDNELALMRFCEAAWPCDMTRDLRRSVEHDRA